MIKEKSSSSASGSGGSLTKGGRHVDGEVSSTGMPLPSCTKSPSSDCAPSSPLMFKKIEDLNKLHSNVPLFKNVFTRIVLFVVVLTIRVCTDRAPCITTWPQSPCSSDRGCSCSRLICLPLFVAMPARDKDLDESSDGSDESGENDSDEEQDDDSDATAEIPAPTRVVAAGDKSEDDEGRHSVKDKMMNKAMQRWQPPADMPTKLQDIALKAVGGARRNPSVSSASTETSSHGVSSTDAMKTLVHQFKTTDQATVEKVSPDAWKKHLSGRLSNLADELEFAVKNPEILVAKHKTAQKLTVGMNTEEVREYALITGKNSDKKKMAFRLMLAQKKLKALKEEYTKETRSGSIDLTKGKFIPFPVIVRKEGGWDIENIVAALTYVMKCFMMPGWVQWSSMTNRVQFFYVQQSRIEYFETCWLQRIQMQPTADPHT